MTEPKVHTVPATRYHLGTVAFGSLLLALLQCLRVVVEYLNDRWTDNMLMVLVNHNFPGLTTSRARTGHSKASSGFSEPASSSLRR
jgi:hypothetical protein